MIPWAVDHHNTQELFSEHGKFFPSEGNQEPHSFKLEGELEKTLKMFSSFPKGPIYSSKLLM